MTWSMLLVLCAIVAYGQATFEVATIKLANSRNIGVSTYPGGRVVAHNRALLDLVQAAFHVQAFQVTGGAAWTREILYDVDVRPPSDSKSSQSNPSNPKLPMNDEQRQMMQALLVERFQLQYHRETREGPVYRLVQTNRKLMLDPAKDKDAYPWAGSPGGGAIAGDGIAGTNISMRELAERLARYLGRLVLDETGLQGSFDFKVEHAASDDSDANLAASIVNDIQVLGLKLEPGRGPVQTVVIDKAEKPSSN